MLPNRRVFFAMLPLLLLPALAFTAEENALRRLPRVNGKILERRCPVHHEAMTVDVVPIHYGLLLPEAAGLAGPRQEVEAYWREKRAYFPETSRGVSGGCIVGVEKEAEVYSCRSCREAEAAWLKKHPAFGMAARKGP
ncbi:MAG: hypothetical protein ACJ75H_18305 [Thermoanaerobaculia bacterium]